MTVWRVWMATRMANSTCQVSCRKNSWMGGWVSPLYSFFTSGMLADIPKEWPFLFGTCFLKQKIERRKKTWFLSVMLLHRGMRCRCCACAFLTITSIFKRQFAPKAARWEANPTDLNHSFTPPHPPPHKKNNKQWPQHGEWSCHCSYLFRSLLRFFA